MNNISATTAKVMGSVSKEHASIHTIILYVLIFAFIYGHQIREKCIS